MNKILIFAPSSEEEVVSSFPLIHLIDEHLNPEEINIIQYGETAKLYNALPYKIKLYDIPKGYYNLLGIHKFSKNLHDVFNISHFFDLRGEFLSQWTGKSFASCERIGESKAWWSKFLLNYPLENIGSRGQDSFYTKLIGEYLKEDISEYRLFNKDQFTTNSVDTCKILFLIDDIDKENGSYDFWYDSFEHFSNQPMTLALYQTGDDTREFLDMSKEKLLESIFLTIHEPEECFELIKVAKIVVTTNRWVARLACYFNKEVLLLTDNIRHYSYGRHFAKGVNLLELNNGEVSMAVLEDSEEILDGDIAWEDLFFRLKEQVLNA